jgi:hypothetical protein
MTLLFLKRLNDTFEENAEKLIKDGKSEKEAYHNKNRHLFYKRQQNLFVIILLFFGLRSLPNQPF